MMEQSFSRNEIVGFVVRISLVSAVTFFSIKWIMERVDPANKSKKKAKARAEEALRRLASNGRSRLTLDKLSDYEMLIAQNIVNPEDIHVSWSSIAGLDSIVEELQETVILPIQRPELFADSQLTQPPKGVLLHGPPGCGKTLIAKATAKAAGTRFINLDVSTLTDKWYGESQKLAAAVFSLAIKLQPCIIFIDEIDSFLRARNSTDHEATAMMKAQFMCFWDGLVTDARTTVVIMGATNRPQDLDAAILRRMPATFHVAMPNVQQRADILGLILHNEPVEDGLDRAKLACLTDGFSGSDLRELCRNASVYRVHEYLRQSKAAAAKKEEVGEEEADGPGGPDSEDEFHDALRPITMDDLLASYRKMRDSKMQCGAIPLQIRLD